MTHSITVAEARALISALLDKVEEGEEVTITRDGRPVARIVSAPVGAVQRQAGDWGWAPDACGPDIFKPMAGEEMQKEGWR